MPAPITKGSPLRPLPMRVTMRQFDRLQEARSRDSYPVQEHVRRALDMYLDLIERSWPNIPSPALPPLPAIQPDTTQRAPSVNARSAAKPAPVAKASAKRVPSVKPKPKVVYR